MPLYCSDAWKRGVGSPGCCVRSIFSTEDLSGPEIKRLIDAVHVLSQSLGTDGDIGHAAKLAVVSLFNLATYHDGIIHVVGSQGQVYQLGQVNSLISELVAQLSS